MKYEKLGNICDLQNGFAFKSGDYIDISSTLLCRMSNIRPDSSFDILYNPKYLPDNFAEKYKDYLLSDGDLVIAMTDMANDPHILGVPTIVVTKGYKLLLNQRVGKLINIDTKKVSIPFLKLALSRNENKIYFKKFAGGGLQLNVGKKEILNLKIPLPPLETQLHIANILTKAESLIARRKESIRLLDEYLKSVFLEMFGDSEQYTAYTLNDLKAGGNESFSNGPFGSDLLTSELTNSGIPVVYIRDLRDGKFNWISNVFVTPEKANQLNKCQVEEGDVLVAKVGTPPGTSAVYRNDNKLAIITQDVIRLRTNNKRVLPNFLSFFINSELGQNLIKKITISGTRSRFSLGDFKKLSIKVPPIELQKQFTQIVEKTENLKAQYQQSLQELENLYGSLSQKAFKGELDLKDKSLLMAAEPEIKYEINK